jgi:ribosomal protein S18 acetylase RimI-like enzyme
MNSNQQISDRFQDLTVVRANTLEDIEKAFSCGLVELYQNIFSEPPYLEYFSDDDVTSMFRHHFTGGNSNSLVFFTYLGEQVIAFCMAVPFNECWVNFEIADSNQNNSIGCHEYFKITFDLTPENTWYLDDLGVKENQRRRGVARYLLKTCLAELNSKNVLLRTSENSIRAKPLYQSLGFSYLDGLYTQVSHKRLNGSVEEDRRIIMLRKTEPVE